MKLAVQRYSALLSTLGVDPEQLAPDSQGTLVAASTPMKRRARLPVLRIEDSGDEPADVRMAQVIGEGGMGTVMAAEQVALGREVAVKILRVKESAQATEDLLREALIAGRLEHPNIVPVYLLGRTPDGAPLFVMRRIEGVPWSAVLRDSAAAPGIFSEARDPLPFHLGVLLKVCEAVQFAHSRGVLHRDLKPDNVMLGSYGEVYVVDWGIAVSLRADPAMPSAAEVRSIAGTPAYMAPEMAAVNAALISERTDVYLLGAVLHEVLTGSPPHAGETVLSQLASAYESVEPDYPAEVPADLAEVCRTAMKSDPAKRFESVNDLRRAVQDCVSHRSSWALSDEADRRARAIAEILARSPSERSAADATRMQELVSECRFGYRQALAAWEGNRAAVEGLQGVLESMVDYELGRGHPEAAGEILAQLPRPSPSLAARVEKATHDQQKEAARVQALERFHSDADIDLGASARGRFGSALGIGWGSLGVLVGWLDRTGRYSFGPKESTIASVLFFAMVAAGALAIKKRMPMNTAQAKILTVAVAMAFAFVVHWAVCWALEVPMRPSLALYLLWIGSGWVAIALLFDARVIASAVAFAVGGFCVALFPAAKFEIFGVCTVVAYGLLARAWRGGTEHEESG